MNTKRAVRQVRMDFDHIPIEQPVVDALVAEMTEVYLRPDGRPWVIGFSGGKDSSAVVQLVYRVLMSLPPEKRTKPVWIISSDTMVENPRVAAWLDKCHAELREAAERYGLPVQVAKVYPRPQDSFWVCLLGKGYPAPTSDFRWCTGRLKIEPSEAFVVQHIEPTGRILQLLGSRKKESKARETSIESHALDGKFGTCGSLTEGIAYMPIQEWDNDNCWEYLRLFPTSWDRPDDTVLIPDSMTGELVPHYNNELFMIYQDGHGGECVLEFDRRTASCGGSRFGCFVCTVVPEDQSMTNMVGGSNPELAPLLAFRQKIIDYRNDHSKRDPVGRKGRLRINSVARTAAAKEWSEANGSAEVFVKAFESGAKWAEHTFYKPDDVEVGDAASAYVEKLDSAPEDGADRFAVRHIFQGGVEWARKALETKAANGEITPGPYLLEVRAELLRDLFEIERALPGFITVTDTDLHWIKYWWDHDGGDPGIVDRLVAEYRGGGGTTA